MLFRSLGLDMTKFTPAGDEIDDKNELTNEELIYLSYKIMRANKVIRTPKAQGSILIDKLKNKSEITSTAKYKAAYAAMIEYGALYGLDFKPQGDANRVYLATIVAWAADNK